ncbi:hypothetical protein EHW66_07360 [Erwinia psidii]|nr:hypothetical protein [Erwinia psidii]
MSTTDNNFTVTLDPNDIIRPSFKARWWHIMDTWKVGIIPLPLFVLAGVLITIDCLGGLPSDIVVMIATLAFFGFACGEFGKRLPLVGKPGAAAICATFIPSAMVYYGLLPDTVVASTTSFYTSTNILYGYICCIIVGNIMSMNRTVLIQGFSGIFFPMLCGDIARDWQHSWFSAGENRRQTGAFGLWMTIADEIPDPHRLAIRTWLNGHKVQEDNTSRISHKVAELIEYIITFTQLSPGDVIITGSPGGVGKKRNPPLFMQEGDRIEVEIKHIGHLSNVIREAPATTLTASH